MSANAIHTTTTQAPTVRRRHRAAAVGAAVAAAAVIWLIAEAAGVDLTVDMKNGQPPMAVGLPIVVTFAAQAALLGWITLAGLERFLPARARVIWTVLAAAVLLFSFVPIAVAEATAGAKVALSLMHLAVAAALVPFLRRYI